VGSIILIIVTIPVAAFILWIDIKKDVPKWATIAMLLATLLLVAEVLIDMSEGISRTVDILLIPAPISALVALGFVVYRMVKVFWG